MTEMRENEHDNVDFCTLGMFIIDEIHFKPPVPPAKDILGGAGSYSAIGARILSPPPLSRTVGWIVDCGSDFPPELRELIASWETSCLLRETPERLTTRGWNGYGEGQHRAFRYMTPKLRLDHEALTPNLLRSKSFHLICSPKRCIHLAHNIMNRCEAIGQTGRPLFIWEPVPDLCTPAEYDNCMEALKCVDVVSPNHSELGGFFGYSMVSREGKLSRHLVEECSTAWLYAGIGPRRNGRVVVRCGKDGCYVAGSEAAKGRWIPAYHQSADAVVDPTGGGNGFLGGLAVGLVRCGQDIMEAALLGSVAASFCIEQVGMPKLEKQPDGETWNGVRARERLEEFRQRLEKYVQP